MPELAEVEFFRRQWLPGVGLTVATVELHPLARVFRGCACPRLLTALPGSRLTTAEAHGKNLLFKFSGGRWLGLHLGMTGELRLDPGHPAPGRHDHLVLRLPGRSLVFADSRMFGRVRFEESPEAPPDWWKSLPPAVMTPAFSQDRVLACLACRPRSPLKAALLDQAAFPGIGNWMADEILWRLGLHPLTPAGSLDPTAAASLRRHVRSVARGALATIGIDWREPPASWLYRHRWSTGTLCPRPHCRSPLRREEAAGRTTCWCPVCQPDTHLTQPTAPRRPVRTGHRREKPLASQR